MLDEFDLFAAKRSKQTLLYNLLDALQTSGMQVGARHGGGRWPGWLQGCRGLTQATWARGQRCRAPPSGAMAARFDGAGSGARRAGPHWRCLHVGHCSFRTAF